MADYHSFRAVNDEGPFVSHLGEITHKDCLLFDFASVSVHEPGPNENLVGIGVVFLFAFIFGKFRRAPKVLILTVELEFEFEVSREVSYWADISKGFCHSNR